MQRGETGPVHRAVFRIDGILIVIVDTKADMRTDGINEAMKWSHRYHNSFGAYLAGAPPLMTMARNASGFTLP